METSTTPADASPRPSDLQLTLLIGRRAAVESLRDRTTRIVSVLFVLVFPLGMVLAVLRPIASGAGPQHDQTLAATLAIYLLMVGLLPTNGAVSIAAGQFAGEKEQGSLAPLLASPASNAAIFGGKVLGSVLPVFVYAALAEVSFVIEVALIIGASALRLVPVTLVLSMVALVPTVAVFGAVVASLISSRVRTYNAAQQITSFVLLPVIFAFIILALNLQAWGPVGPLIAVVVTAGIDIVLILIGAATWRREEVLAQR
jgi:ABC-type Na+ efflux pump permease subunit